MTVYIWQADLTEDDGSETKYLMAEVGRPPRDQMSPDESLLSWNWALLGTSNEELRKTKMGEPTIRFRRGGDVRDMTAREVVEEGRYWDIGERNPKMCTMIGDQQITVSSVGAAAELWDSYKEATGADQSDIGNGIELFDDNGNRIAAISYDSRIWTGEDLLRYDELNEHAEIFDD